MWDRRIDTLVARTRTRPLAAGILTPRQAFVFLGGQLVVGLGILLQLNWPSIGLGALALIPVSFYPLMKRITYWPQFVLGLAFNWGILLGWTAQTGSLELPVVLPLYMAGISWTLVYDTIYALQDLSDDLHAGVKSTAIRFGDNVRIWLSGFAALSIGAFAYAGVQNSMGPLYYAGITAAAGHYMWQILTLRRQSASDCLRKFKSNHWLGALVWAGILGDLALQRLSLDLASFLSFKSFL